MENTENMANTVMGKNMDMDTDMGKTNKTTKSLKEI